jgi:hypothetical protein
LDKLHLEGPVGALNHDAFVGKKPSAFVSVRLSSGRSLRLLLLKTLCLLLSRLAWASHLEALVSDGGDNPFLARNSSSAFATFATFVFENLFAYFYLDVFFCSDHGWMRAEPIANEQSPAAPP